MRKGRGGRGGTTHGRVRGKGSHMQRSSMRRLVGAAAALLVIGPPLLSTAGSAIGAPSGGTTRLIYVAADPAFKANNFQLSFSGVSAGGQAVSTVYVKN